MAYPLNFRQCESDVVETPIIFVVGVKRSLNLDFEFTKTSSLGADPDIINL